MRYMAILKDSLREAWDSWVLLGLLALSSLVILFAAQLSFHPQSAEKTMEYFFAPNPFQAPILYQALNSRKPEKLMLMRGEWSGFHLEKVDLVRGEADMPTSEYALTVIVGKARGGDFGMPDVHVQGNGVEKKKPAVDLDMEKANLRKLFQDAEDLGYIKVADIALTKADEKKEERHYRVVVQGTSDTHRIWATEPGLLFGFVRFEFFKFLAGPLAWNLYNLSSSIIYFGSLIAVLMAIVITSFFFPNMLRKGCIDMLLVKPISRPTLLIYKYLGGLAFILLTTAFAIGGIWFVLGIRSGLWAHGTLLLIPGITFFFAILYAISTLVSVVTRSVVASILLAVGAWFVFFVIGKIYTGVDFIERMEKTDDERRELRKKEAKEPEERWTGGWTFMIIKSIHAVSPRTEDLNQLTDLIVFTDFMTGNITRMREFDNSKRNWWESLGVSLAWIAIFLGLSCAWFHWKDY